MCVDTIQILKGNMPSSSREYRIQDMLLKNPTLQMLAGTLYRSYTIFHCDIILVETEFLQHIQNHLHFQFHLLFDFR